MANRVRIVVLVAAALAAVDIADKSAQTTAAWDFHHRSATWAVSSLAFLLLAAALARLPSTWVAISAGVAAGGVCGNLLSASLHEGLVPNPLVVGSPNASVTFNLADTFVTGGALGLMVSLMAVTIRHRELLPKRPFEWARVAARRLRS